MKHPTSVDWKCFRELVFDIISRNTNETKHKLLSKIYDWYMIVLIVASLVPLTLTEHYAFFTVIEWITVIAFIIDYLARWFTAPEMFKGRSHPYMRYPFTFMAIADILSILPIFSLISSKFKLFKLFRLFRIIQLIKFTRYSKQIDTFIMVIENKKDVLLSVFALAILYIFVTALIMFNAEPRVNPLTGQTTFQTFFDALYWSTITLTSVGYGDLYPVSGIGRLISMISSLFGIAIIAMPTSVITAEYLSVLNKNHEINKCNS
ncbi:MAG: ion transporter [Muribaculaceae bacterium]|nr:ion transporter [Muribaculaceae bacterium]